MAYEVLARKWRPRRFEEVIGQDHVVTTLRNAIEKNRIAQAYLLSGPRGTGKTTLARIFAKALNCVNGPTTTPCCECDACKDIANGTSFDVTEIDGASNNKVDDVHKKIIETVNFAPIGGKYRIYYIDEVHMLSASAFNALLKTLEEPPLHVKFIFATTEPEKIIGTVLSRCQRFDLRRIALPDIIKQLRIIAEADQINIDDDALLAIARGADGSMRDAESAFDQLIAFTGKEIREADVLSVFGLVARETIEKLAKAVLIGDVARVLNAVEKLDKSGKDLRRLTAELINHFRNLLVCIHLNGSTDGLNLTDAQCSTITEQSEICSPTKVLTIMENMISLEQQLKQALAPRTLVETTLIRSARASNLVDLETILRKLSKLKDVPNAGTPEAPSSTPPSTPSTQPDTRTQQAKSAPATSPPSPSEAASPAPAQHTPSAPSASTSYSPSTGSPSQQTASAPVGPSEAERNERIIERPVVQEALKTFDGRIINITHK